MAEEPHAEPGGESPPDDRAADEPGHGSDAPTEGVSDPLTIQPGEWSRRATLRDGTRVLLRQVRSEDRDRLVEGLRRLSAESRYLRFHADLAELSDEQLDYLTQVDHVDHEAIIAIDMDRPEEPGIGVARYIRDAYERHVAEAAVTVLDEFHGQGAGTILLGALAVRARQHGVEVFRNYVLASNEAMLAVFDDLGASREPEAGGIWRVDLPLPTRTSDLPDSPAGKAFMTAAKEEFRLCSLFPPVLRFVPGNARTGSTSDALAESQLSDLRDELDRWLADRERRTDVWPTASEDPEDEQEDRDPTD